MIITYSHSISTQSRISEPRKNPRTFPTSPLADHIPMTVPSVSTLNHWFTRKSSTGQAVNWQNPKTISAAPGIRYWMQKGRSPMSPCSSCMSSPMTGMTAQPRAVSVPKMRQMVVFLELPSMRKRKKKPSPKEMQTSPSKSPRKMLSSWKVFSKQGFTEEYPMRRIWMATQAVKVSTYVRYFIGAWRIYSQYSTGQLTILGLKMEVTNTDMMRIQRQGRDHSWQEQRWQRPRVEVLAKPLNWVEWRKVAKTTLSPSDSLCWKYSGECAFFSEKSPTWPSKDALSSSPSPLRAYTDRIYSSCTCTAYSSCSPSLKKETVPSLCETTMRSVLLAMQVSSESCGREVAVVSPSRRSQRRMVISLLTEYSSLSLWSLKAETLLLWPFKVAQRFSFPESHTFIKLSSPQDTIRQAPPKRTIRTQESCLPMTVVRCQLKPFPISVNLS